jgi:NitT/TauT family transport system substrate-binding protein
VLSKFGIGARPAMVGYVFDEGWARTNSRAVARFLAAAREAKEILATSDAEWERIAPLTGVRGEALTVFRDRYREGIPRRPVADEEADARVLYRILARQGGSELVGPATELAPGTFLSPPAAE